MTAPKTEEYLAFVLSDECRDQLLSAFTPQFPNVKCHHVTLLQPDSPYMKGDRLALNHMLEHHGAIVMHATGYVSDSYTDALTIEPVVWPQSLRPLVGGKSLHVTMSVADGHTSAEANNLKDATWFPMEPLQLEGTLQLLTRKAKEPAGFSPQHFPNGTVFEIKDSMLNHVGEERQSVYIVVNGIVRNGIDSYVLKTGVMREHTGEQGLNIDHVKAIIKRGSGPVVIDQGWYGFKTNKAVAEDVYLGQWTEPLNGWKPRKGFHATLSLRAVVFQALTGIAQEGVMLDYDRIMEGVVNQTWCRSLRVSNWFEAQIVNKKRLRRWLKANINRFLVPMAPALREQEKREREDFEREMESDDREYARMHPEPTSLEGSSFDDIDDIDDFDDLRFWPAGFLTHFFIEQMPLYEEAVRTWKQAELFEVRVGNAFGVSTCQGSLFFFGSGSLDEFWRHFDAVEAKWQASGADSLESLPLAAQPNSN